MKVESYEPYHIGIKVNPAIPIRQLRQKIIDNVSELGLQAEAGEVIPPNVSTEILVKKSDVRIEFNYVALALNTIGQTPNEVYSVFEKLLNLLTKLGYDTSSVALFYELATTVNVSVDGNAMTILNNSVKCNMNPLKEIVSDITVHGIRYDIGFEEKERDMLRVLVGLNPINPQTLLAFKITLQTRNQEKINEVTKTIENMVLTMANSMVGN